MLQHTVVGSVAVTHKFFHYKHSVFALGVATLMLGGCSGFNLYNIEHDKSAQGAKEKYEEAKLLNVIPSHETNLTEMLSHELDVARRYVRARAEADLSLLFEGNKKLGEVWRNGQVIERLRKLGVKGKTSDDVRRNTNLYAKEMVRLGQYRTQLKTVGEVFKTNTGLAAPACNTDGTTADISKERKAWIEKNVAAGELKDDAEYFFETVHKPYAKACNEYRNDKKIDITLVGLLPDAIKKWDAAELEIATLKLSAKKSKIAALKKLCLIRTGDENLKPGNKSCAVDTPKPTGSGKPTEIFKDQIENVEGALSAMAQGANAFSGLDAAEIRIAEIEKVLTSIAGGDVDAEAFTEKGEKVAAMTAALLSLADTAQALAKASETAPVSALLMEKQRLEAQRDAAAARVARMEARRDLLKAKADSMSREIDQLREALKFAGWATEAAKAETGKADPMMGTMADLLAGKSGDLAKERMDVALQLYASSILVNRREQEEADWRDIALDYLGAMEESQAGIAEWNALVVTPINQIAAYHASGIKPEQISALLVQAIGLSGIAVGVNK